jgi:hypothetical protein
LSDNPPLDARTGAMITAIAGASALKSVSDSKVQVKIKKRGY